MKASAKTIDLGISADDMREQVITRAADLLVERIDSGDYSRLERIAKEATDKAVAKYAEKTVLPMLEKELDRITFEETNKWGEKRGGKFTFKEYIVARAEAWLKEEVDYQGKPKGTDSYQWRAHQTRVAHMVHEHLAFHISNAMQAALKTANSAIVQGLEQTVKIKLAEIQTALSVKTEVKK